MPYVGQDWRSTGNNWKRTDSGWRDGGNVENENVRNLPSTFTNTYGSHSDANGNQIDVWQPIMWQIQGVSTKERRTLVSLSDAFLKMEISTIAVQVSGFCFCAEVFRQLLHEKFSKLSGTFKTYMFKTMEKMLEAALSSEFHLPVMTALLQTSILTLDTSQGPGQLPGIGSKVLWKKSTDTVNCMISKTAKFEYTQPDESRMVLLDLPKECLHNIIQRLPDHRDIIRLGSTCSYLHELIKDPFLWRGMCFFHFTEKQLYPFVRNAELNEVDWLEIYKNCFKKIKTLKCVYGNQMAMCNNCRSVFWRIQGHACLHADNPVSFTLMTPSDFINLFHL